MDEPIPAATEERTDGPEQAGTALQRYVIEPFWAGLLAGSLGVSLLALLELLRRMHVMQPRPEELFVALLVLIPLLLAMARGFPTRARGPRQVIGRIVGVLLFGVSCAFALAGLQIVLLEALDVRRKTAFAMMTLVSAICAAIAYAVVQRRRAREALRTPDAEQVEAMRSARSIPEVVLAGLFGGGLGLWMFSTGAVYSREYLIVSTPRESWVFSMAFVAMLLALGVAFRSPVRSYASLIGRVVGLLVIGFLSAFAVLLLVMLVAKAVGARDQSGFFWASIAAALLGAFALYRQHGLPEERRRRRAFVFALGLVLFLPLWGYGALIRCLAGGAYACMIASERFDDWALASKSKNLHDIALAIAETGCERGSPYSCVIAASYAQRELWGPPDLARAERSLQTACALEYTDSCSDADWIALVRRCEEGKSAIACVRVGEMYMHPPDNRHDEAVGKRYYRRACLLGDASACSR